MTKKILKKTLSVILTFNLLLQSFAPFFVVPVFANDSTASAAVSEPSPTPAPEFTPEPTPEITPEVTPTVEATPTPEITPATSPSISATLDTPDATPTIEVSPSIEPTPTEEPVITTEPTPNTESQAPPSENQPENSPSEPSQANPEPEDVQIETKVPEVITLAASLEQALLPAPTLTTDKSDYFPTDIAYISGSGFLANTIYTLHIMSSDMPFVSYKAEVTSDESGSLSYAYQLDGNYRPNYSVDALDDSETVIASMAFTDDSDKVDICHSTDSQTNPYVTNQPSKTADAGGHDGHNGPVWFPGIIVGWGDIIPPFTYSGGSYPGKNWTLQSEAIHKNKCNVPSDLTIRKTNNLSDSIGSVGVAFNWKVRIDNIGLSSAQFEENEIIFEDNLPNSNVTYGSLNIQTSDVDHGSEIICSTTSNTIVCKVKDNKEIKIKAGGYVEVSIPVTFLVSGTYTNPKSGGSCRVDPSGLIKELDEFNNNCSDTVKINSPFGSLKIIKIVDNGSTGATYAKTDFQMKVDGENISQNVSTEFTVGDHIVSESGPSGYKASYSDSCPEGKISLALGDNKTCTVTNTALPPKLTVTKIVTNNNRGQKGVSDFPLFVGGVSVTSGEKNTFTVGDHIVSESGPSGYKASYSDSCPEGKISLALGDDKTCTITNDDQPGKLIVKKVVIGGSKTADDFSFTVNDGKSTFFEDGGQNEISVDEGSYTVVEDTDSDYEAIYENCEKVSISNGAEETCTITNTRKTGNLFLDKIIFEGPAIQSDWSFEVHDLLGGLLGTLKDNGTDNSISNLETGNYKVSESTGVLGYSISSVGGVCGGLISQTATATVGTGDNTCTFTNTRDRGSVKVNKQVDLNGDGDYLDEGETSNDIANELGFRWKLNSGENQNMGAQVDSVPTTISGSVEYTVSENTIDGYHFVGWSTNGSCTDPNTSSPINVTVNKGVLSTITLCNARDTGTITIVKDASPDSSDSFKFTGNLGEFDLVDDGGDNSLYKKIFTGVGSDTYTVTEPAVKGWTLDSITCEGGSDVKTNNRNAVIKLSSDENVTCTFKNTRDTGSITIIKEALVKSDTDFDFTGDLGSFSLLDDGGDNSLYKKSYGPISTGEYTVTESELSGWTLDKVSCNGETVDIDESSIKIDLEKGDSITCTFYNSPNGSIHGYKWSDKDMDSSRDEGEDLLSGWTIELYESDGEDGFKLDPIKSTVTSDGDAHFGWYWFENLLPGKYKVCEINQPGWSQTFPNDPECYIINLPDQNSYGFEKSKNATDGYEYNFGNVELANLTVYKFRDDNQDGVKDEDEPTLPDWEINLSKIESKADTLTTDEDGKVVFENLLPGRYNLSENLQEGWSQSNIYCQKEQQEDETFSRSIFSTSNVSLDAGQDLTCYIGNYTDPIINISKSNSAGGDKTPGSSVVYRILVEILNSQVSGLTVKDLLPKGFTYRSGSFQVWVNGLNLTGSFDEPEYHSPGTWNLGNFNGGDKIELLYTADISGDQQPGLYPDSAWAVGTSLAEAKVFALAQPEGFVDTNFVGTTVNIVKDQTRSDDYGVERLVEGQVLGASTSLPDTGANELWLLVSLASLYVGIKLVRSSKAK